jgi:hypothetical protein
MTVLYPVNRNEMKQREGEIEILFSWGKDKPLIIFPKGMIKGLFANGIPQGIINTLPLPN